MAQATGRRGSADRALRVQPTARLALANKLARMVYLKLTRGEAFVDQGQQHYEEQQRQRSVAALKRRAAALGYLPVLFLVRPRA